MAAVCFSALLTSLAKTGTMAWKDQGRAGRLLYSRGGLIQRAVMVEEGGPMSHPFAFYLKCFH